MINVMWMIQNSDEDFYLSIRIVTTHHPLGVGSTS
jgi:hypothetical protein